MIQAVKNGQLRVSAYRHLKSKSRERSGGNIVNAASKRILFSPRFRPLSPCLQPALRAPSSPSRGPDYVSSVRSTVAPPSRPPRFAAAATAIIVETWTDPKTCAPVSHTMTLKADIRTHTHVYHTWVWLYGPTSWLRRTCTFLYITNTSAVEATKRLIFPHWIIDQYLLWFIISTLILCHVFASSLQQRCCPCFGV